MHDLNAVFNPRIHVIQGDNVFGVAVMFSGMSISVYRLQMIRSADTPRRSSSSSFLHFNIERISLPLQ